MTCLAHVTTDAFGGDPPAAQRGTSDRERGEMRDGNEGQITIFPNLRNLRPKFEAFPIRVHLR